MKIMPVMDSVEEVSVPSGSPPASPPRLDQVYLARLTADPEVGWNLTTCTALALLILFWAVRMYTTWATWGDLSIDSGREMYVPAVLLQGKMLYRDVWYLYGPAGPYFNSYLLRWFGVHMEVFYWAGSLSALACAVLLFLTGKQLSSWMAGWAAGAVVLLQAFQPGLFCFPLAYSFSSVYGCVTACAFLYVAVRASRSNHWGWMFAAGTASAAALLLKLEYGAACYAALVLLMAGRCIRHRSGKNFVQDALAILPGIVVCGLVIRWMVSIAGVQFITQENIMSWPGSFFMKTYGKMWLERGGFALNGAAFHEAMVRAGFFVLILAETYCLTWWKRLDARSLYLRFLIFLGILYYYMFYQGWRPAGFLAAVFFPRDLVFYVSLAAIPLWWYFLRRPISDRSLAVAVMLSFSGLLAFRVLLNLSAIGYPIYYDGPAVLAFLLLLRPILPRWGRWQRFPFLGEAVICFGCMAAVGFNMQTIDTTAAGYVKLTTERGSILTTRTIAKNYQAALAFMKEKGAQGESVLSVPEDTSLYFLSGMDCPTRVYAFTPGTVAPGKMTKELFQEMESKPVRYLLWSNRIFPEYGVPRFGGDFDQELGNYLKLHYHRVGFLVPIANFWELHFVVWERNVEAERRSALPKTSGQESALLRKP